MSKVRKTRVAIVLIIALCLFTSTAVSSFAASSKTRKMTVYDEVIKLGNSVYCCDGYKIYKVDDITNTVTVLVNVKSMSWISGMSIHKGYLYYCIGYNHPEVDIRRIKLTGGKTKLVYRAKHCENISAYAIKGSRVYVQYKNGDSGKTIKRSVKLNGKSKKKSKYKVKNTVNKTNVPNYSIYEYENAARESYITYLVKPNGQKIRLAEIFSDDYE